MEDGHGISPLDAPHEETAAAGRRIHRMQHESVVGIFRQMQDD